MSTTAVAKTSNPSSHPLSATTAADGPITPPKGSVGLYLSPAFGAGYEFQTWTTDPRTGHAGWRTLINRDGADG